MELLVKIGNAYPQWHPCHHIGWRDGQILQWAKDGTFSEGSQHYRSQVVVKTALPFSLLTGKGANELRKYSKSTANGKYEWDFGYEEIPPVGGIRQRRRRDWFVDFKRLLDQGLIDKSTFLSIYNKQANHNPIYIDRDPASFILHEDYDSRIETEYTYLPGSYSAGDIGIGSGSDPGGYDAWYNTWAAAVADMTALTGDVNLIGHTAEEISETEVADFGINFGTYTVTCKPASGQKFTGTAYGSGHRINYGAETDYFSVNEDSAGYVGNLVIQDLAVQTSDYFVYANNGGDTYHTIIERCVIKGNSNVRTLIWQNRYSNFPKLIVRNNFLYNSDENGIQFAADDSDTDTHILNNTVVNCAKHGIYDWTASPAGTNSVKNNLCQDNGDGSTYFDYASDGSWSSINTARNISKDASSPDASYRSMDKTGDFTNYANYDVTLDNADTDLDDGDDLSAIGTPEQFADDILDESRVTWYIGCCEYASAGGGSLEVDVSSVEAASEITSAAITATRALAISDPAAASEVSDAIITATRALALGSPAADSSVGEAALLVKRHLGVSDVEAASQVASVIVTAAKNLSPTAVSVASEVGSVLLTALRRLAAAGIATDSEVTAVTLSVVRALSVTSVEAGSEVTSPTVQLAGIVGLNLSSPEVASTVTTVALALLRLLATTAVSAATSVGAVDVDIVGEGGGRWGLLTGVY